MQIMGAKGIKGNPLRTSRLSEILVKRFSLLSLSLLLFALSGCNRKIAVQNAESKSQLGNTTVQNNAEDEMPQGCSSEALALNVFKKRELPNSVVWRVDFCSQSVGVQKLILKELRVVANVRIGVRFDELTQMVERSAVDRNAIKITFPEQLVSIYLLGTLFDLGRENHVLLSPTIYLTSVDGTLCGLQTDKIDVGFKGAKMVSRDGVNQTLVTEGAAKVLEGLFFGENPIGSLFQKALVKRVNEELSQMREWVSCPRSL